MANSNWNKTPLKNLCTRIGDGLHGTPEYTDNSDIFFINGNNLKNGNIVITKDTKKVTYIELENNYIQLNKNTLLLSINGTLGSMAFYNNEKVMLGKSAAYLNFKTDINKFYYYYFQLEGVQEYFYNVATGSTIKNLSLKSIQDFVVPFPEEKEWKPIAKVLSDLDAKIELNNKINQELEAMAKTLYDYWFVQFDFPCLPSGQVNPNEEMDKKIKAVCTYRQTGGLPLPDGKKCFVYVIECMDGTLYKGMTNNLYRRYYEHYTGQGAEWTKVHKPKRIIHYEKFNSQKEAAEREKELKTGYGRTWLKREYEKLIKEETANFSNKIKSGLPAPKTKLRKAGKMVYNEELKREVPVGWEVGTLDSIGEIIGGSTPSKAIDNNFCFNSGTSWITPKDLSLNKGNKFITRGEYDVTDTGIKDASLKIMPKGTVLLSSRAPIGYLAISRENVTTNQGFKSFVPKSYFTTEFIYYTIKNSIKTIEAYSSGSTFKEVSLSVIKTIKTCLPTKFIIENYNTKGLPIFKRQDLIELENQQLTALRDWLLPMLMNGQVTVSEAEEKLSLAAEPQAEYKKG